MGVLSIRSIRARRQITDVCAVVAILFVIVYGIADTLRTAERAAAVRAQFWATLTIRGDEVEGYETIAGMSAAADLVVRGTFSNFRFGRQIRGDAAEDVVTYAVADLTVSEELRGRVPAKMLPVEFLLNEGSELAQGVIAAQAARLPDSDMVLFLRHKGGSEAGLYRLVNAMGLWTDTDGTLSTPLATEAEQPAHRIDTGSPTVSAEERARQRAEDLAARPPTEPSSADEDWDEEADVVTDDLTENAAEALPESGEEKYAAELTGMTTLDDLEGVILD